MIDIRSREDVGAWIGYQCRVLRSFDGVRRSVFGAMWAMKRRDWWRGSIVDSTTEQDVEDVVKML